MIYSLVLVNKPVINSDKNEKVGKVKKYVVDPATKKVVAFILVPEPGQSALDIVPYSNVKSVYNNAVIIENMPSLIKMSEAPEILNTFMMDIPIIGSQVITDTGMLAGTVRDFAFREKDGLLVRLSLTPDKDSVSRIHAKHIITIAKQRIIISALALKEEVSDDEPEEETAASRPVPAAPAPVKAEPEETEDSDPETISAADTSSKPAPVEKKTYAKDDDEPFVASPGPASYARMPGDGASIEEVTSIMKEMFAEMSEVLLTRLSALVAKENLDDMKKEIISALKEKSEGEDETPSLEILVEEKIKRGAGRHLEEIKETLAGISRAVEKGGESDKVLEKIDSVQKSVAEAGSKTIDAIKDAVKESKPEIDAKSLASEISGSVEKVVRELEATVPGREDIAGQLREFATRYEERADAILTTTKAEMDRYAEMLGLKEDGAGVLSENAAREMLQELRSGVLSALETTALQEKVESSAQALKDKLEALASDVKSAGEQTAAEVRTTSEKLEEALKESLSGAALSEKLDGTSAAVRSAVENVSGELKAAVANLEGAIKDSLSGEAAQRVALGDNLRAELENQRHALIEEIKSFAENVMKPDDLDVVRQWISDIRNADDNEKLVESLRSVGGEIESKVTAAVSAGAGKLDEVALELSQKLEAKINGIADAAGKAGAETEKLVEDLSIAIDGMKTGILDARQEIGSIKDQVSAKQGEFEAALKGLGETLEFKVGVLVEKAAQNQPVTGDDLREVKDALMSGLSEIRGGVGADIQREISGAAAGNEERIEKLNAAMRDMVEKAEALNEKTFSGIREELSSRLNDATREMAEKAEAFNEKTFSGIREELTSKLNDVRGGILDELNGILESRLGGVAGAADLQGIKEHLENSFSGAMDEIKANIEKRHGGVLEEIKSLFGSREVALRDIGAKLDARNSDAPKEFEALKDYIEKTVAPLVDGVKKNLEDRMATVAGINDLETARQKIEEKFGAATDRMVESIEKRLDERDEEIGQGLQAILKKVEKTFQGRQQQSAPDNIFGGGGILNAIFGSGRSSGEAPAPQSQPSMKISSRTERPSGSARFAKGSDILEENHIRRLAYLIGKKLRQDVVDPHGNVLAMEGDVVDEEMIRRLRDAHCTLPLIRSVDFGD